MAHDGSQKTPPAGDADGALWWIGIRVACRGMRSARQAGAGGRHAKSMGVGNLVVENSERPAGHVDKLDNVFVYAA